MDQTGIKSVIPRPTELQVDLQKRQNSFMSLFLFFVLAFFGFLATSTIDVMNLVIEPDNFTVRYQHAKKMTSIT